MSEYVCEVKDDYEGVPWESDDYSGTCERREEVVRCRDCKHYVVMFEGEPCEERDCAVRPVRRDWDAYPFRIISPDGFCAWGRRRDTP